MIITELAFFQMKWKTFSRYFENLPRLILGKNRIDIEPEIIM